MSKHVKLKSVNGVIAGDFASYNKQLYKVITYCLLLSLIFIVIYIILHPFNVKAASYNVCSPSKQIFNVGYCDGYFTGTRDGDSSGSDIVDVLPNGLSNVPNVNVTTSAVLIQNIGDDLYLHCSSGCNSSCTATDCQIHRGAAFIVDTMMGDNSFKGTRGGWTGGVNAAEASLKRSSSGVYFGLWVNLVKFYCSSSNNCSNNQGPSPNSTYGVYWVSPNSMCGPGGPTTGSLNSGWSPNLQDDTFHLSDCLPNNKPLDATPQMEFFGPNNYTFFIGQNCGNVESSANLQQPPSLSCGSPVFDPSNIDPNTQFAVTVSIASNSGSAPSGTMTLNIKNSAGITIISPPAMAAVSSGLTASSTFSNLGPIGTTGTYTVDWTFSASGFSDVNCSQPFPVADHPYLRVYGGDVSVTGSPELIYSNGFSSNPTPGCEESQTSGGIFSWNNGSTTYSGAGTQYAVYALGDIDGFASAMGSSSSPEPPSGLAFAYPTGSGNYGGSFGTKEGQADCDFTYDCLFQTGSLFTTSDSSCPNNEPICPENATPSNKLICPSNSIPSLIKLGVSKTIFTFNSVYITNNSITYQQNTNSSGQVIGWKNPSQIPYFRLVVLGGNIYIAPNVTELDGIYVAEPSVDSKGNKVGGTIYTCATGNLSKNQTPVVNPTSIPGYPSTCNQQLQIYGSFIAEQVEFLRTFGSIGDASKDALDSSSTNPLKAPATDGAEVFEYTPEVWLPRSTNIPADNYTAISGLPPVL